MPFLHQKQTARNTLLAGLLFGAISNSALAAGATLTINASGDVEQRCSVLAENNTNRIQLELGGKAHHPIAVDCNTPFTYSLSSQNGGLYNQTARVGGGDIRRLIPYNVGVNIPLSQGNRSAINDSCTSNSIKQQTCNLSDSGSGIAIDQEGTVSVTLAHDRNAVYVAGGYTDTLTIDVQAK